MRKLNWDDMMGKLIVEQMQHPDALLLGRRTYEIFAAHWPRVTDPNDPVATKLNSMRKYVVSRTLGKVEWNNSSLISYDAPAAIARLKEQAGGDLWIPGPRAQASSSTAMSEQATSSTAPSRSMSLAHPANSGTIARQGTEVRMTKYTPSRTEPPLSGLQRCPSG